MVDVDLQLVGDGPSYAVSRKDARTQRHGQLLDDDQPGVQRVRTDLKQYLVELETDHGEYEALLDQEGSRITIEAAPGNLFEEGFYAEPDPRVEVTYRLDEELDENSKVRYRNSPPGYPDEKREFPSPILDRPGAIFAQFDDFTMDDSSRVWADEDYQGGVYGMKAAVEDSNGTIIAESDWEPQIVQRFRPDYDPQEVKTKRAKSIFNLLFG